MAIEFQCPRCQSQIQVPEGDAGAKLRCPQCQGKVRVPDLPSRPTSDAAIEFLCPRCQTQIQAPVAQAGSKQLCPKCQGKVRVPTPVGPVRSSAAIEFLCPRCSAQMSARPEHAGVKQFCPKCGGKVRVPAANPVPVPTARAEQPGSTATPVPQPAASIAAIVDEEALEGVSLPSMRRRRRSYLGWVIPVACMGMLAAIGSLMMKKPPVKLEGKLTGERLTDLELGPFRVDNRYLGQSKREAQEVFERLDSAPVRAVSQSLTMEFKGIAGGIEILLRTSDQAEFYRVDPARDKRLAAFVDDNKQKFRAAVEADLERAVPEFLQAVEKRTERDRELKDLAEFRESVGMASLMRASGFGYQVQAAIGKQAYPCLLEDNQGRLFFALPAGTQEFDLVGHDRALKTEKDAVRFPGRYTVQVSDQTLTINREAPDANDANEKVRKALKK